MKRLPKVPISPGALYYNKELSLEHQQRICAWVAVYKTNQWIIDKFMGDYGIAITDNMVNYYRYTEHWRHVILKKREEYNSYISDEEFSSKRRRVQELSKAYGRLEVKEDTLMDAVKVMSHIREEIEGKSSNEVTVNQYNQYNAVSDDELRRIISENNKFLEQKKSITVEATDAVRIEEKK